MSTKNKVNFSENQLTLIYSNLESACRYLDEVYDVDNGGCCFVAYCIARVLEKDNIPFSVIVYECFEETFEDIDCSQYHYAIKFNGEIVNKFYECGYTEYNYVSSRMLLEHYKECNWNTQYNSDKNKYIQLVLTTTYNDTKEEILQGQCDSSEQ